MLQKNKNNIVSEIEKAASYAGMAVMLVATVISATELAERQGHRAVDSLQPAYAYAGQNTDSKQHGADQAARGREEIRHTSATFGAVMRQHSVSGSL